MRRRGPPPRRERDAHRINRHIRVPRIRVIGPDGDQAGIMSPEDGRKIAREAGLDLVEVAPGAKPPVCKVMDYGKFKYDQAKKKKANSSDKVTVKEIRLRPKTDDHDLETKLRKASGFLDKGNPVRFVMRMRGRERAFANRWVSQLRDIVGDLDDVTVVSQPRHEGRTITAMVEPAAEEATT